MNTSVSSFRLFAFIPALILPSGHKSRRSRDLSLQDKERACALGPRTLSRLHDIMSHGMNAGGANVHIRASTCTRCHHASHWVEQMNNMPVTDLIHLPTPELYRDTIYLSLWVCARVWACIRACFSKCFKAALQYLLSKSEIIPLFASCSFLILCIYEQFFVPSLYLDCFWTPLWCGP